MRKTFIYSLLCFLSYTAQAQLDTFNIARYRLPDYKWQSLQFSGNLEGHTLKQNYYTEIGEEKVRNLDGEFNIDYYFFKNTKRMQQTDYISINSTLNYTGYTKPIKMYNLFESIYLNYSLLNTFFYNKNYFFETGINGNSYSWNKAEKEDSLKKMNSQFEIPFAFPINVGKGRIEDVTNSQLAIYVFKELYKQKRLSRLPTDTEIFEFTDLITTTLSKRLFDSRIKRINTIESVDSFLQAKGLISEKDARYFATVNDNLYFTNNPTRKSGSRFSVGIAPIYSYLKFRYDNDETDSYYQFSQIGYGTQFSANYLIEKALSLKTQSTFSFSLLYEMRKSDLKSFGTYVSTDKRSTFAAKTSYSIGYFPNSRTSFLFTSSLNYVYDDYKEIVPQVNTLHKSFGIYPHASINIQYYITPKLTVTSRIQSSYGYKETSYQPKINKDENLDHHIQIGFTYNIF